MLTIGSLNGKRLYYDSGASGRNDGDRRSDSKPTLPSGGGGGGTAAAAPWSFPQYSQTWAFTPPPVPSGTLTPPPFDPKSSTGYAGMTPAKGSKTPAMTLMELWKKYGLA